MIFTVTDITLHAGDPAAVVWIFRLLSKYAGMKFQSRYKFTVEQLKEQLEAEYGIDLDAASADNEEAAPPTTEEKDIIQRSGRVSAEDRDWIL